MIENRSSAGHIGNTAVATSPPDGSVLLYGSSSLSVAQSLYASMNVLPARDLAPVMLALRGALILRAAATRLMDYVGDGLVFARW
ncbi:tripartite tricarboxylate transporter substrate-binding protein [Bradyrhizobium sp. LHD-71]|uniref:tripartite tricarboxylate transporter substrate-binding protein n=1 Tax=Bradyrhizobium sp. LHD-71 TaxID=3072141 RepID=UPI0035BE124D